MRNTLGQFTGNKYKKIDGVWFKGKCTDCGKLIKSHLAKLCSICYATSKRGKVPENFIIKQKRFRGTKAQYAGIHAWVKIQLGKPNRCVKCNITVDSPYKIHWANISGEYKKDINDWVRLCSSCHFIFDTKGLDK